ncbi:MAG: DUF4868 domain-containing protein [Lachnospiraceae bacterium]|nr:DUF4868 domain-containing protein [Lachnospiraceae bacterium]
MKIKIKVTDKGKSEAINAKLKSKMVQRLESFFADDDYGFEMYVLAKTEPVLRAFHLDDSTPSISSFDKGSDESFKTRIEKCIKNAIIGKYIGFDDEERENIRYDDGTYIADNQKKMYVFKQSDAFKPFEMLTMPEDQIGDFRQKDIDDVKGFLFRFSRGRDVLWGYQHYYGITVSKNKGIRGILNPFEDGEVFQEFTKLLITITGKIAILIDKEEIITDQVNLLQRYFGFEMYIDAVAKNTVNAVEKLDIVKNMEKLTDYIGRGKTSIYKKKVMRIANSKVLLHPKEMILKNINESARWKDTFKFQDDRIVLEKYQDVENLIDLLDERYTVSQITGEEYDTDVKKPAKPRSTVAVKKF